MRRMAPVGQAAAARRRVSASAPAGSLTHALRAPSSMKTRGAVARQNEAPMQRARSTTIFNVPRSLLAPSDTLNLARFRRLRGPPVALFVVPYFLLVSV